MSEKPFISNDKYETTGETKEFYGRTLHRIRAKISIGLVAAGTISGWIETEANLSLGDNAWVYGNAQVSGNARVSGNAWVYGNARVSGNAQVSGDARVYGDAQWLIITPIGSENGTLTAFVEKDGGIRVTRGCFSGSLDEFVAAVEKRHGESQHGQVYKLAAEMIRLRFKP